MNGSQRTIAVALVLAVSYVCLYTCDGGVYVTTIPIAVWIVATVILPARESLIEIVAQLESTYG